MLVDLVCASASIEPVRRDLELILCDTVAIWLLSYCQIDFALLVSFTLHALRTFAVLCFRLHLNCLFDRGGSSLPNLVPETFDIPTSGGLIESILLFF